MLQSNMLFDLPNDDILYDALLARSSDYEGQAFVCVKSTGILLPALMSRPQAEAGEHFVLRQHFRCINSGFRPADVAARWEDASGKDPLVKELVDC